LLSGLSVYRYDCVHITLLDFVLNARDSIVDLGDVFFPLEYAADVDMKIPTRGVEH
jgi:hypothetical protein